MNLLLGILALIFVALPLHELGHYLIALRLHWHPISMELKTWHKIPYAVAVVAINHIEIKSNLDFFKVYKEITTFYAMGSLFSMMGISVCYTLGVFSSDFSFFFMTTMASYMMYEITGLKHKPSI